MTAGSDVKQLLATIKNLEAGLSTLALKTLDETEKRVFHEEMLRMAEVKEELMERIRKRGRPV
ncbi:DUF1657 domain-containing protein [Halobacillus sp. Marseille-Q1614]|uniref:DUF1657 domain-containing protein n=1 Tax=Halobacillus sp. Marseille-Q1614 TaxID=2709134 RepID=UPI0020C28933|nr:DUF1657 domain-containing protein [Halobacillus sp. Marseille-Q1614]